MDGAPPIGQQLGVEVEYRPVDEGHNFIVVFSVAEITDGQSKPEGRDGLIFDAHADVCLHFALNVNTVKTLNFSKLRPIRTTVYTAHTCTSSAYWPLRCIRLVKLLLKYNVVTVFYVHFFYCDQPNYRAYANESSCRL